MADDETYRRAARRMYHEDGEIEIVTDAAVSASDEGAYVQAWVWVGAEDLTDEDRVAE